MSFCYDGSAVLNGLYGSVAELAYAADLKSAALGLVGSNPTAPTSSPVGAHRMCPSGAHPNTNITESVD